MFLLVFFLSFRLNQNILKWKKKMNKLLLESIDRDIEIILDNQVEIKFSFDSYKRGFHIYKDVRIVMFPWKGKHNKHTNLQLGMYH